MRNVAVLLAASAVLIAGCSSLSFHDGDSSTGSGGRASVGAGAAAEGPGAAGGGAVTDVATEMNTPQPSDTGPSSTGAAGFHACQYDPTANYQQITTVPDPTRSVDSAVYARAALRSGLAPDPSVLRLNDFLNLYGSTIDETPGMIDQGEVEYLYPEGIVEARFVIPAASTHQKRSFVMLVDTSLSMAAGFDIERAAVKAVAARLDASQGDELHVVGWSSTVVDIYDGTSSSDLDSALDKAFAHPGGSSDLGSALTKTLAVAESSAAIEKHVFVMTDGGATTNGAGAAIQGFADQGVRLDVALVAPSTRLIDGAKGFRATAYNQSLLTSLTEIDGARLLLSDVVSSGGTSDVEALIGERFDEFFGVALGAPRAQLAIPGMLQFVSSGVLTSDADALVARGVGFGRMLTFRSRVNDLSHIDPSQLPAGCSDELILASLVGVNGSIQGSVSAPVGPLGQTRRAISAYVAALRDPNATSFLAAQKALSTANSASSCDAQNASDSHPALCKINAEMAELLALYPQNVQND